MKNVYSAIVAVSLVLAAGVGFQRLIASESNIAQRFEYATVRWAGRDNTPVIRPGGKVEMVGQQLANVKKPDRADERSFYQNVVMNALANEGYEFAGISNDDVIMKRVAHQ
ncbi:MAG: hypothetical protein ACLQVY_26200 [Limisphaerales bacterium]